MWWCFVVRFLDFVVLRVVIWCLVEDFFFTVIGLWTVVGMTVVDNVVVLATVDVVVATVVDSSIIFGSKFIVVPNLSMELKAVVTCINSDGIVVMTWLLLLLFSLLSAKVVNKLTGIVVKTLLLLLFALLSGKVVNELSGIVLKTSSLLLAPLSGTVVKELIESPSNVVPKFSVI